VTVRDAPRRQLIAHALQIALPSCPLGPHRPRAVVPTPAARDERHLKLSRARLRSRELNAQAIDLGCRRSTSAAAARQLTAQPVALCSSGIFGGAHRFVRMFDLARQQPVDAVHAAPRSR